MLRLRSGPARDPREMREPFLRISPQAGCSAADLDQLAAALAAR